MVMNEIGRDIRSRVEGKLKLTRHNELFSGTSYHLNLIDRDGNDIAYLGLNPVNHSDWSLECSRLSPYLELDLEGPPSSTARIFPYEVPNQEFS
jgi:hypothetical protein